MTVLQETFLFGATWFSTIRLLYPFLFRYLAIIYLLALLNLCGKMSRAAVFLCLALITGESSAHAHATCIGWIANECQRHSVICDHDLCIGKICCILCRGNGDRGGQTIFSASEKKKNLKINSRISKKKKLVILLCPNASILFQYNQSRSPYKVKKIKK